MGDGVVLAGQVGVADHINIGDGAVAGGGTAVVTDIPTGQQVWGVLPAGELRSHLKSVSVFNRLPKLAKELKEISRKVKSLETAKDNK